MTQEEIDNLQPPSDGTQRNFEGLLENLRSYKIEKQLRSYRKPGVEGIQQHPWE